MSSKRFFSLAFVLLAITMAARADITIGTVSYHADTLVHRQVGPGIIHTVICIPDFPLNVYLLETDLNNPYNRVETTIGYNTVGKTELLTNAFARNRTATSRPVAACNANFWTVASQSPWSDFCLGSPFGAVVRNDSVYVNSEMNSDSWNGGPTNTGGCAISHDKTLYFGRFTCEGIITSERFAQPVTLRTVNRRNVGDAVSLWTGAYGRSREFETNWVEFSTRGDALADNYYLTLKPGSAWAVGKDMTFVVQKIVPSADRQTLGDYDACLTATGAMKETMALLQVGDEITINHGWNYAEENKVRPLIANMVEGNANVMHNGVLTQRNYNESYNTMVYSRTAYGCDATGKKLYMIVIDRSKSPTLGQSNGCTTEQMCHILKSLYPDISEVENMDAGGSAEMMIDGKIINTTTEGTPRPVACGWMLATEGPEDNEVASIQFYDFRIMMPVYSSRTPRIVGFNRYGEIVDDDVQGFTLSCDDNLGTTAGNVFTASGNVIAGTLTASLGSMTAQVPVTILEAQPSIVAKPTIVVDDRPHDVRVTATVDNETFFYDPASLQWSVDDPTVATINAGRLQGLKNGSTAITCQMGAFTDRADVEVQISEQPLVEQPWEGWTLKGAGTKDLALAADGTLTFSYSSNRSPYITLTKDCVLYSLPCEVGLAFTGTLPIDKVQIDVRNHHFTKQHYMEFASLDAGVEHTLLLDMEELGGVDELATFPLTIKAIKFTPAKSNYGDNGIKLRLFARYPVTAVAPGDVDGNGVVNGSDVTALYTILLDGAEPPASADVDGNGVVNGSDVTALYTILLQ